MFLFVCNVNHIIITQICSINPHQTEHLCLLICGKVLTQCQIRLVICCDHNMIIRIDTARIRLDLADRLAVICNDLALYRIVCILGDLTLHGITFYLSCCHRHCK